MSGVRACARQYPGEKEITFPPYTCLESHGDARLERDAKGNEVVIFPLKVSPPLPFNWTPTAWPCLAAALLLPGFCGC